MHNKNQEKSAAQLAAISHGEGPAFVLAGPGSGKTTVLTHRIQNLIESYHISPEHILVITFTKAASLEMKERFHKLSGGRFPQVTFGTFHAVFFHILKYVCHFDTSSLIRESEKQEYLKEILKKIKKEKIQKERIPKEGIEKENSEYQADAGTAVMLLGEISRVKNFGISIDSYESKTFDFSREEFREIYREYRRLFQVHKKLDFDDMALSCCQLLSKDKEVRKFWSDKYQYLLVDEFQDINAVQYKTLRLLAHHRNNLFVVGDDDQSIYGFRGAKPGIMKGFLKDYPEAQQYFLTVNYRCSGNITQVSQKMIGENQDRFSKKIVSSRERGNKVILHGFGTEEEQTENIIHVIKELIKHHGRYQDICLIFRTNLQMGHFGEQLLFHQIPFQMKEKPTHLFSHFIACDIVHYLSFALYQKRRDFFCVMNKPLRYLSRNACKETKISWEELREFYKGKPSMEERVQKLAFQMKLIANQNTKDAIAFIRKGIGYEEYLKKLGKEKEIRVEEWLDLLKKLQTGAEKFPVITDWLDYVDDTLSKLKERTKDTKKEENAVVLHTMHGVKGLEYKTVILPQLNEGVIPHKRAESPEEIEEERRLFYVAVTRAKERLFLFYQCKKTERKEPSRFLWGILKENQDSSSSIISSCSDSSR